jgi:hypothetical protein
MGWSDVAMWVGAQSMLILAEGHTLQSEKNIGAAKGHLSLCCGVPGKIKAGLERDLGDLPQDFWNWTQKGTALTVRLKNAVHHRNHL